MKKSKTYRKIKNSSEAPIDKTLKVCALGVVITFCIGFFVLLLGTAIAYSMPDATALVNPIGYTSIFITSLLGGFAISKLEGRAPFLASIITGICFVILSMLLSFALPHAYASGLDVIYRLILHAISLALFPVGTFLGIKARRPLRKNKKYKR